MVVWIDGPRAEGWSECQPTPPRVCFSVLRDQATQQEAVSRPVERERASLSSQGTGTGNILGKTRSISFVSENKPNHSLSVGGVRE